MSALEKKQFLLDVLQELIDGAMPSDVILWSAADYYGFCSLWREITNCSAMYMRALRRFNAWHTELSPCYPVILANRIVNLEERIEVAVSGEACYSNAQSDKTMWADSDYGDARREYIREFRDWLQELEIA